MRWTALISIVFIAGCASQPPPATSVASQSVPASAAFADLVNDFRRQNGRAPVQRNPRLVRVAETHARDMARRGVLSHRGSDGSSVRQRVDRGGYQGCLWAENIAEGYPTEAAVFTGWKTSRGHRRNMLLREAQDYGLARVGRYWVMVLAASC